MSNKPMSFEDALQIVLTFVRDEMVTRKFGDKPLSTEHEAKMNEACDSLEAAIRFINLIK